MISRYTRPEMGRIWSEENSFQKWLDVEILAAEGLARMGRVPKAAISRIRKKARLDVKRIRAIEAEVKHETIAFLSAVAETIGDDARHLHVGMTSSDVMDTALAIQFKEASALLEQDIKDLLTVLRRQARKYKWTVMIGRTHGVHAEPITFGLKLAIWYQEMERHLSRFRQAVRDIVSGKSRARWAHLRKSRRRSRLMSARKPGSNLRRFRTRLSSATVMPIIFDPRGDRELA